MLFDDCIIVIKLLGPLVSLHYFYISLLFHFPPPFFKIYICQLIFPSDPTPILSNSWKNCCSKVLPMLFDQCTIVTKLMDNILFTNYFYIPLPIHFPSPFFRINIYYFDPFCQQLLIFGSLFPQPNHLSVSN